MSRYTSYTLEFTDDRTNPDRERNRIDLSPFVISNFTHHMMGEISGRRHMASRRRRPTRCNCRGLQACIHCRPTLLPEFASDNMMGVFQLNDEVPSIVEVTRPRSRIATFKCEGDLGECSICQSQMKKGEMICRVPCQETVSHAFHKDCITPWLERNNTCPNCRSQL